MLNDMKGFTQGFLKSRLHHLNEEEDWETFMDILTLTLYGVLLFPKAKHFVEYAAIDAFIVFKAWSKNPVMAVLVDVYLALNSCHNKRNRYLVCCLSMLYVWMFARFEERVVGVKYPSGRLHGNNNHDSYTSVISSSMFHLKELRVALITT